MLLLVLACSSPSDDGTPSDDSTPADDSAPTDDTADQRFVATGVTSLDGTDPTNRGYDDLRVLAPLVGDARLVSIGEPVHFSNSYAEMRSRVIPWLVEEQGFRVVAFEGGWFWAQTGRPYIEDEVGTIRDAMSSLGFDSWLSLATADMIEWLHDWNIAHPDDKVQWFGFDVQWFPDDFTFLRDTVRATDPDAEATLWKGVTECLGGTYQVWTDYYDDTYGMAVYAGTADYTEEQRAECQVGIDAIQGWATENEDAIAAAVGDDAPSLVDIAIVAVTAAQKQFAWQEDLYDSWGARDEGMAGVLQRLWTLQAPDAKVAVFAHNDHLFRNPEALESAVFYYKGLGQWLAESLGDDYVMLAQLGSETTYNWYQQGPTTVVAGSGAYETAIGALGDWDALLVDVRTAAEAGVLPEGPLEFNTPNVDVGLPVDQMNAAFWYRSSPEMEVWNDW